MNLNVNLEPCTCHHRGPTQREDDHPYPCHAKPVLVPCQLPSQVVFLIRPGECLGFRSDRNGCDGEWQSLSPSGPNYHYHSAHCPARPLQISCTLGGDGTSWKRSEVVSVSVPGRLAGTPSAEALLPKCRDLWQLMRALVLGQDVDAVPKPLCFARPVARLLSHRDEMFASIAALAKLEQAAFKEQERAVRVLGEADFLPDNFHRAQPEARPSASLLERYVWSLPNRLGELG